MVVTNTHRDTQAHRVTTPRSTSVAIIEIEYLGLPFGKWFVAA